LSLCVSSHGPGPADSRWLTWLYTFGDPSALSAAYGGVGLGSKSALVIPRGTHPIDVLLKRGEETFARLNASQSTTLQESVKEYRRRYGRNPPKGFDKWWEWAKERGITLIDGTCQSGWVCGNKLTVEYDSESVGLVVTDRSYTPRPGAVLGPVGGADRGAAEELLETGEQ
jgi:hypothetical protein